MRDIKKLGIGLAIAVSLGFSGCGEGESTSVESTSVEIKQSSQYLTITISEDASIVHFSWNPTGMIADQNKYTHLQSSNTDGEDLIQFSMSSNYANVVTHCVKEADEPFSVKYLCNTNYGSTALQAYIYLDDNVTIIEETDSNSIQLQLAKITHNANDTYTVEYLK